MRFARRVQEPDSGRDRGTDAPAHLPMGRAGWAMCMNMFGGLLKVSDFCENITHGGMHGASKFGLRRQAPHMISVAVMLASPRARHASCTSDRFPSVAVDNGFVGK